MSWLKKGLSEIDLSQKENPNPEKRHFIFLPFFNNTYEGRGHIWMNGSDDFLPFFEGEVGFPTCGNYIKLYKGKYSWEQMSHTRFQVGIYMLYSGKLNVK